MPSDFPHQTRLANRYDKAASRWHAAISHLGYPAAYGRMIPPLRPAARVLDAGAGTGAFAEALLRSGRRPRHVDLLDSSAAMLARAGARMAALHQPHTLLNQPLQTIPLAPPYDLILCAHLIEHFADITQPLHQLHSMLNPGGQLALVTSRPHWCTRLVRLRWHHSALPAATVQAALQVTGFSDIQPVTFPHGPPARMSHGFIATRKETS